MSAPLALVYAFMCLASWYLCRYFPLGETNPLRLLGVYLPAAVVSSSIWVLIGKGWAGALSSTPWLALLEAKYAQQVPLLLGVGSLLFFLATAIHYLLSSFESAREAERRAFALRILAREAELKALKAQIDPHFLFNSLNSISALTSIDAGRARKMCLLLADFLRASLALGNRTLIPLTEEIALASHYLAIEQVRLGPRLNIVEDVEEASGTCQVPPLLLQPLVENAVRHGITNLLEGGSIRIRTRRLGDRLSVMIENPVDEEAPACKGKGIGLENVRTRLAALYQAEARLETQKTQHGFRVELSLPAEPPEEK